MKQKIILTAKDHIAIDTMAFRFQKPMGFVYLAGQYGNFSLLHPPETDDEGDSRNFSFASAPYEPEIMIVTRMRDTAYKRTLKSLPLGTELEFEGPFGSFSLPNDISVPLVFLTGGVGSTFVRSMIAQAIHDGLRHRIVCLYSARSVHDAVFMDELAADAASNDNFTFVPTLTQPDDQWTGKAGRITADMLSEYVSQPTEAVYYLSGSGEMIGAMRKILNDMNVPRYNVRLDNFVGY